MGQALLKTKAVLRYFKVISGNRYYNGHVLRKGQLYCKVRQVLQIWARATTKWGR